MIGPRPRLRPDLIIREVSDPQAGRRYQVRNPATKEVFDLGEEELFLCRQIDATDDFAAVQSAFASRFALSISAEDLADFCRQMQEFGLLEIASTTDVIETKTPSAAPETEESKAPESSVASETPPSPRKSRLSQRYRWEFFNAGSFLARLGRRLHGLHWVSWGLVPGVPLALLILLHHQPQYLRELKSIDQVGFHLIVKLTVGLFCVNLLSKILQGATSAYYGGEVSGFGMRLAFGVVPRFFVNRGMRNLARRERLWVYATPLLVKLGFFVLGVLVWQLNLQAPSRLGAYGLVLGHLALAEALFIINPLWPAAEGYAWLTTYLGVHHLRERAFIALRLALRNAHPLRLLSPREKYALLVYGTASLTYLLLIFGTVLFGAALHLEKRMQGVGVLLFLILLMAFLAWALPYLKAQPVIRGGVGLGQQQSQAALLNPDDQMNASIPSPAASMLVRENRWRRRFFHIGLMIAIGLILSLPYPYAVTGGTTLLPSRYVEVHTKVPGIVTDVIVRENQWVKEDEVLANLDDLKSRYDVETAKAGIEKKQQELDLLLSGPKPEAIALVQQQIAQTRTAATHNRKLQEALYPGFKQGVVSGVQYEQALRDAEVSEAALLVAEANLTLLKSPPQPQDVAIKRAELQQLQEQLKYAQEQLDASELSAPVAGRIVTANPEFKEGSFLKEGDLFATLEDTQKIQVEVLVPETDIGLVQLDAPVTLRVWAYPLRDFEGRVTLIANVTQALPDNPGIRVARVVTLIDNPDGLLKGQMTGYAKIAAGHEPVIVAFTRALVRFVMLEMWSWLP
jgi:putative peptide zinc metalloprotease protein